jgi:hypothetical protein
MMLEVVPATRDNVMFGIGHACITARHGDEAIFIAADTGRECYAHETFLTKLAKQHPGVSMQQIHEYLHETVMADIAEANPDTLEILEQWRRDEAAIAAIFERGPSITELVAIADYERGCLAWLAEHHRDPAVRKRLRLDLVEIDALHAANAERARGMLERRRLANGHAKGN